MFYFIYDWVDDHDIPFYVGMTNNPNIREIQHLKRNRKIEQLRSKGVASRMRILEAVEGKEIARKQEKHWIQTYRDQGIKLINVQLNGIIKLKPIKKPKQKVVKVKVVEQYISRSIHGKEAWREVRKQAWEECLKEARHGKKLYFGRGEITLEALREIFESTWDMGCFFGNDPDCYCEELDWYEVDSIETIKG